MAYNKFETFHRPVEMSIVDYLNESERLYNQIKHDTELPIGVLAYRVLKNANITHKNTATSLCNINIVDILKVCINSLKLFMIAFLNQAHRHLELKKKYFFLLKV